MLDSSLLDPAQFFLRLSELSDEELLDFLIAWHERGETADELSNFANYVFGQQARIETGFDVYDCAGTGGDAANTFNISTTAAIIAAGAGLKVSKNGGRRTTSKSGSVDVLEAMGFNLAADHKLRLLGLEKHNLAFFASNTTGTLLVRVKELCRKHGKTAFISLLGPLTSPIKLKGQIIGLGQKRWLEPLEGALSNFIKNQDLNRACLLRSVGIRLDELSSCTDAELSFVFRSAQFSGAQNASGAELLLADLDCLNFSFNPEDLGLKRSAMSELTGGDAVTNAGLIKALLTGEAQDQVKLETACLNAALLLLLDRDLLALDAVGKQGLDVQIEFNRLMLKNYQIAMAAVESGAVWRNFQNLLDLLRTDL